MSDQDATCRRRLADQAVATLDARAKRLGLALTAARVYLWDWDVVSDEITWARELDQILELKSAPASKVALQKLIFPDDLPAFNDLLAEALSGSRLEFQAEFRVVRSNGQTRWTRCHAIAIRDGSETTVRMVGSAQDITDQKFAEQALIEREAALRTAFSSVSAAEAACCSGTWDWDIARNRIYVSSSYRDLYGLPSDQDVTYQTWLGSVHPEDRPYAKEYGQTFLDNGSRYDLEFRIEHPTKGTRWLAAIGGLTRDQDGTPIRFSGINIDITDRRKAEAARQLQLPHQAQTYPIGRETSEGGKDAIVTIAGESALVTSWNSGAEQLFGYSEAEAVGASISDLILPDQAPEGSGGVCAIALSRGFAHEETFRRHKDGALIPVTATAARTVTMDGALIGVSLVFRDARRRQQTEAKLRLNEERLHLALTAGRLGPWELDLDSGQLWLHANAAKMHGIGETDVLLPLDQFHSRVHPDDLPKMLSARGSGLSSPNPSRIEIRFRMPNGAYRWFASMPTVIRDELGRPTKMTGVNEDITSQKAKERALQLSEARLKLGVSVAGFGLGDIDYIAGTISLDEVAAAAFQLPSRSMLPRSVLHERFHEDEREQIQIAIRALLDKDGTGILALEHRIRLPDGKVKWLQARKHVNYAHDASGRRYATTGLLAIMDITERKQAEEKLHLLMGEVAHRDKNLLALVQALARQTFGSSTTSERARLFEDRLLSIAACQDLLINSEWKGVGLHELIETQLQHFSDVSSTRIHVSGPSLTVSATAAQAIGMAIHELATNAAKYGALSNESGVVDVTWELVDGGAQGQFVCRWREMGGPKVKAPARKGFGHSVTIRAPMAALNANVILDYAADGVLWELRAPISTVIEPAP